MKAVKAKIQERHGWQGKVRVIVIQPDGSREITEIKNTIQGVGLNMQRDALAGVVTDEKIKYLAWLNAAEEEFGRKAITTYDATTPYELLTTTYVAPYEATEETIEYLAWFAGVAATSTPGSGIKVAQVAYSRAKTNLESLQVERTDILSEVV